MVEEEVLIHAEVVAASAKTKGSGATTLFVGDDDSALLVEVGEVEMVVEVLARRKRRKRWAEGTREGERGE